MGPLLLEADLTGDPAPDRLWRTVLATLDAHDLADVPSVRVAGPPSLVLWDVETLGSPRAAVLPPDERTDPTVGLAWLARHEPHTWALVLQERYAVGPLASYLLARATRGLLHLTDDPAWSAARAGELGVPDDVLPALVAPGASVGRTDPAVLRGLAVPIGF
jgi:hypothetical protein